jgi:hypothetical protein
LPLETIARAYAGHHQIVNAIADCEGGDDFVRKQGGLHCVFRKHCVPYFANDEATEPCGVEMLESYDTDVNNEMAANNLKYKVPDVSGLKMGEHLKREDLVFFEKNLPRDTDQFVEVAEALDELCMADDGFVDDGEANQQFAVV